jgi:hypothetical protein
MGMDGSRRAGGAIPTSLIRAFIGALAAAALCLCAAACSTAPQGAMASAAPVPHGPTVAFESIDGPPSTIFNRLVQDLGEEASARQVAVVSREGPAQYRVRGYLAAVVQGKRRNTIITWVWDIYDADQQRALRISGEVPAGGSGGGTWAAADDGVVRRIATSSMDQLAAFLAAPPTPPAPAPAAPPSAAGPNVAAGSPDPTATLAYAGSRR